MRLEFVLITGLVLQLADPSLASGTNIDDEKVGIFYFDGSNEGYAEYEDDDSVSSAIEEWNRPEYHSRSRIVSLGTWMKPEKNTSGLNKIMEFKYVRHFELLVEGDRLKLLELVDEQSEDVAVEVQAEGEERQWDGDEVIEAESEERLTAQQSVGCRIFTYPDLKVSMNEWLFVLITVDTRSSSLPSVYIKGLDKAPLKQLDYQITVQGCPEKEKIRSNKLTLGRGFTGRIAPVLIGRHYSSTYFNRYKDCLTSRDHSSSACTELMNSLLSGSNLASSYKLNPNSNIRLEPYTEINVSFDTDIQCKDSAVTLNIIPTAFNLPTPTSKSAYIYDHYYGRQRRGYYLDYPINITLGELESGCNLTWVSSEPNSGYEISNTNLTSCGFKRRVDGEQIIYTSSVYSHTHTETTKLMDVSCRYTPRPVKREIVTVSAYVVEEISLETSHTFTPWSLSLHLYSDSSYSEELEMPVRLGNTGENIYAEAKVESSVKGAMLDIESCRTHITLNELDEMQKTLIRNYETVSPSIEMLKTDDTTRKRFRFKADKFEEYPKAMVYLSCVLTAKQGEVAATTNEKGGAAFTGTTKKGDAAPTVGTRIW